MTATDNYKLRARDQNRDMVVLVRVSPRDITSLTPVDYYFSSALADTPAGATSGEPAHHWTPLLVEVASIRAPGEFCTTDVGLCSTSVVLNEGAISPLAYLLDGAAVSIWLWERGLTDWDDALPVLLNARVLSWVITGETLTLEVRQRTDWNRDLTPVEVTPEAYPFAPDESIGQKIPIVYGSVRDIPMRPPFTEYPLAEDTTGATINRGVSMLLGGRRAGSAVLVDTGRGAGAVGNPAARILCASHKVKRVGDHSTGTGFYMKGEQERLIPIDVTTPGTDIINTISEAGILLRDNNTTAWVPAYPVEVDPVANSAENFRAVLDPWNDVNYAKLDWTAGYKTIRMKLPGLADLGELVGIYMFVCYRNPTGTNVKYRFRNITNASTPVDASLTTTSTIRILMARLSTVWGNAVAPWPVAPWAFSECEIEVGWPTSTPVITGSGLAEIYFAGFVVNYRPRQDVIASERIWDHAPTRPMTPRPHIGWSGTVWQPYSTRDIIPAITELKSKFYANVDGYADDGEVSSAGDFTGSSNALIERPPDIFMHMLMKYGGEPFTAFENAVDFGNFLLARDLLVTSRRTDMKCAFSIGQTTDVMTAITWLTQASVSLVILDRFTDMWKFIPWRLDSAVDYDWTFRPQDIVEQGSLTAQRTPLNNLLTGLTLGYSNDSASGQFQQKVRLGWNGSNAGYKYRGERDGYLTVVSGANDKLDFATGSAATATLTPGTYIDGGTFGQMVTAQMKVADGGHDHCVSHGCTIIAGWNDVFAFKLNSSSVEYTYTIPAGVYASFDALATAIQTASGVSCNYNRATRTMSFTRSAGTAITMHNGTGSLVVMRFFATIGFVLTTDIVVSGVSIAQYERSEEMFAVSALSGPVFIISWETGTNGINGTRLNCDALLGFIGLRDSNIGGAFSYLADGPKGAHEQALTLTASRFGARRDTTEDLRAVLDSDTAREVRNRVCALLGKPRIVVTFSSDKCHDLERGRIIGFTSDFDSILPYPDADSDGSWLDKRFVVVETEQVLGPVAFYMKVRAVSLD